MGRMPQLTDIMTFPGANMLGMLKYIIAKNKFMIKAYTPCLQN